jgi:hypothetical protein
MQDASSSLASEISRVVFQVQLHRRAYKRHQKLDPIYAHQTTQNTNTAPSPDSYGLLFQPTSTRPRLPYGRPTPSCSRNGS